MFRFMLDNYSLNSTITSGKYKGHIVSDIVNDKDAIKTILKEGGSFDDEVLKLAGFRKKVRDVSVINEVVQHDIVEKKSYPKETENLRTIIKGLSNNEFPDD